MKYERISEAVFLSRENRFVAKVKRSGEVFTCHVKNTGRCAEQFLPETPCYIQESENPNRMTGFDLIAIQKGKELVNVDSQAPNRVFEEWLWESGYIPDLNRIKREAVYGGSRLDFFLEAGDRQIYVEVKGVTLEKNGVAMFPDAPTLRGIRHLEELARSVREGKEGLAVFIIQMKGVHAFRPNEITHPAFGEALRNARAQGVKLLALDCTVTPDTLRASEAVEILLD